MKFKRILGLSLVGVSILSSLSRLTVTGAVVGTQESLSFKLISIAGILLGFVLLQDRETPSTRTKSLQELIQENELDGTSTLILDTSAILRGKEYLLDLLQRFPGEIYAPRSIQRELEKNPNNEQLLRSKEWKKVKTGIPGDNRDEYAANLRLAREYIKDSIKHKAWEELVPYFKGDKTDAKAIESKWGQEIRRIKNEARQPGRGPPSDYECLKYINKRWKATRGDAEVLAYAINRAYAQKDNHRGRVKILANDSHIEDAWKQISRDKGDLKGYIGYDSLAT